MKLLSIVAGLCAATLCSCASDETASTSDDLTQKPKGALGLAPKLAFGQKASVALAGSELNVYDIVLQAGDNVRIDDAVTSGNFVPDFTLYLGGTSTVKSASYNRTASKLSKTYTATTSGHYILAVHTQDGKGAGNYDLIATCAGGPCAGASVKPIADSEAALEALFPGGAHDGWGVTASEPLAMVKEYIKIEYTTQFSSFSFERDATAIETDAMVAGTLTVKAAQDAVRQSIAITLGVLGKQSEIPAVQNKAAAILDDLVSAGASFGFDGFAQNYCDGPTTQLLVLDSTKSQVYGVDLTPCRQ
jgi:hypothetical protein